MDEVEGWWITANVRRVPMSACRVEDRFFNLCGELCIMENEMKIHSQLDETKLKLDSSSLYNEVDPTGPRPARSVSERSRPKGRRAADTPYGLGSLVKTNAPLNKTRRSENCETTGGSNYSTHSIMHSTR